MNHDASGAAPVAIAAERLRLAAETGQPCAPVRDLIGADDVAAAYAVQERLTEWRLADGSSVVGRKIGLTSAAVQAQMGVDQPDFGVLFDDMMFADGGIIPFPFVVQPRVEAEIAFVLESDLVDGDLDASQVRRAIAYGVAALEVCGSRIDSWDLTFGDTVADNASAGAFVLGTRRRRLSEFDPVTVEMAMTIDGVEVATGVGAASLGDPINAVVWLARTARDLGSPLRAGQTVLSGALGPMSPVVAGSRVSATISALGTVSITFSQEEPS